MSEALARLKDIVGAKGFIEAPAEQAPYLTEWRRRWTGRTPLIVRPAHEDELRQVIAVCHEAGLAVTPQGGNTGLVGGQIPDGEILLSMTRMNRVGAADPDTLTIEAEAGATLASVQAAAREAGCVFPLSIASEGSATIGGLIATNAGGVHVIRYGMMRERVARLRVAVPPGRALTAGSLLAKDNTGFDLKALFAGSEGTLGVIASAVLHLERAPEETATAMAALPSADAALGLLRLLQTRAGPYVSAFELMPRFGLELVRDHMAGRDPFDAPAPWYALIELEGEREAGVTLRLETALEAALERGLAVDAVVAQSHAERDELWALRDNLSEAQTHAGGSIKNDVSVPVGAIPTLLEQAEALAQRLAPGARLCAFGHMGDGNIHLNISQPEGADKDAFLAGRDAMEAAAQALVMDLGGSISAEHGIGVAKREALARYKDPGALAAMRAIKAALDPKGIMNPRVLFAPGD